MYHVQAASPSRISIQTLTSSTTYTTVSLAFAGGAESDLGLRTGAVHDGSRVPFDGCRTCTVEDPGPCVRYGTVYGRTVSVQTRHSTAVYGRCTAVR